MAARREPFNMTPRPTTSPAMAAAEPSPWHSPVPYLFGGLAAMLGLIAFALLILACSYWKLSGYLDNDGERDLEAGEATKEGGEKKAEEYDEKFLVIMAGQLQPTYLATQVSSRSSSFGEKACSCGEDDRKLGGREQGSDEDDAKQSQSQSQSQSSSSSSSSPPGEEETAATPH